MTALGWIAATEQKLFATRVGRLRPRTSPRRRSRVSPVVWIIAAVVIIAIIAVILGLA